MEEKNLPVTLSGGAFIIPLPAAMSFDTVLAAIKAEVVDEENKSGLEAAWERVAASGQLVIAGAVTSESFTLRRVLGNSAYSTMGAMITGTVDFVPGRSRVIRLRFEPNPSMSTMLDASNLPILLMLADGAVAWLSGKPSLFSGCYSELVFAAAAIAIGGFFIKVYMRRRIPPDRELSEFVFELVKKLQAGETQLIENPPPDLT